MQTNQNNLYESYQSYQGNQAICMKVRDTSVGEGAN